MYNVVLCEIQGTQYFYLYKKTMIFYELEKKIGGTRDRWGLSYSMKSTTLKHYNNKNAYKLPHLQHGYRNFLKEWALMENMATYGEEKKIKSQDMLNYWNKSYVTMYIMYIFYIKK